MELGKKVTIFDSEWGKNSAPRERQKIPWRVNVIGSIVSVYNTLLLSCSSSQLL